MGVTDMFPEAQVIPSDPDRRYTTRSTIEWCRAIAETYRPFDLDAAADAESHWSERYCVAPGEVDPRAFAVDGLSVPWCGLVWCNPPYSHLEPWLRKAWAETERGDCEVLMLLPGNRTEQPFWQSLVEPFRDGRSTRNGVELTTHFIPARVRFGWPGNPEGFGAGSPPFTCVLLVFRKALP